MTSKYAIAIDAGTGSIRAVLFQENGKEISSVSRDWHHKELPDYPGSMDFQTTENSKLIVEILAELVKISGIHPTDIIAISATAMREAFALVDENYDDIWACANVDARSVAQVKEYKKLGLETELYKRTGQTFALAAQPRLKWLEEFMPEVLQKTHHLIMLSEWILLKLGASPVIEPSNGSTSGLVDLKTRKSDSSLLDDFNLPSSFLPPTVEPGTVVGKLSTSISQSTGLSEDTLLVVGGGDTQMAALATGVTSAGKALVVGGTFWQQAVTMDQPTVDEYQRVRINCTALPHLWWGEAIAFHVGTVVRWWRDTFCEAERIQASEKNIPLLAYLDQQAERIPAGSLNIIPIFSDKMNYGAWTHAAPSFLNIPMHLPPETTRAAMYRSILENAAIVANLNLKMITDFSGEQISEIIFAGGGSKSKLWAQILSDVTGLKVRVPINKEATATGSALCAFYGAGIYDDLAKAADSWVLWDYEVSPSTENTTAYKIATENWLAAYSPQLELANNGVTTPLWSAPGI